MGVPRGDACLHQLGHLPLTEPAIMYYLGYHFFTVNFNFTLNTQQYNIGDKFINANLHLTLRLARLIVSGNIGYDLIFLIYCFLMLYDLFANLDSTDITPCAIAALYQSAALPFKYGI